MGIKRTLHPVSMAAVMMGFIGHSAIAQAAETVSHNNAMDTSTTNQAEAQSKHAPSKNAPSKNAPSKDNAASQSIGDEHILVRGKRSDNILTQQTGVDLMPQDVMHTPQTINLVPAKIMEEQNVKSLDEALKNVPGVTSSVGEGRGGMSGDQFLIRGFQAQNDIYEDGLRDFGVYSRDSFNYDNVVVIKGPSSSVFGNGTTGGAINVVTKKPILKDQYKAEFSGGNGDYYRGTFDLNKQINDNIALRMEGMANSNNVVGRDYIYSHRWGLAPSVAFGLGTDVSYVIQYVHQQEDRIPDYGIPVINKPGHAIGKPATEYGISRKNWYGNKMDSDQSQDNQVTGRLTYNVTPDIVIHNDTRYGNYQRQYSVTRPQCKANVCSIPYFQGRPGDALVTTAGPNPYDQSTWSFQNVLSTIADFHTSFLKHQLTAGVDIAYAHDVRDYGQYSSPLPNNNLVHPSPDLPYPISILPGDRHETHASAATGAGDPAKKMGHSRDVGAFLYDQIWFTQAWSVKGGFRYDNWESSYNTLGGSVSSPFAAHHMSTNDNVFNPTISLLFNPNDQQAYYFTWASSTTPLGMYLTNSYSAMTDSENGMKPEKSHLYEIGGKWSLLDQRLGITASLFHLEKSNQMVSDPLSGAVTSTGDKGYNQGFEMGISGNITKHWSVYGAFAAYHSKVTGSTTPGNKGNRMFYVPSHQGNLWTTYDILPNTPYNILIGGGVTWRGPVYLSNANNSKVPSNVTIDAMLSHKFDDHWKVSFNIYNLTNRLNYDALFSTRATPSNGRAFMFSLNMLE